MTSTFSGGSPLVHLLTFGFKYQAGEKPPPGCHEVYDCRSIRDPSKLPGVMKKTGLDPTVQAFVASRPSAQRILNAAMGYCLRHLGAGPRTIGFGCHGGRHRSVAVAELLKAELATKFGVTDVTIEHRHVTPSVISIAELRAARHAARQKR